MNLKKIKQEVVYKEASRVVSQLKENGFLSFFAGGVVRDMILGREYFEIDIATSATPEEVESIFETTIPVGKNFGVIIVRKNGINFEVATFRKDLEYIDGRRPEKIAFVTPEEDAKRRDFTINGMFFDPEKKEVFDFVSGKEDLKKKIIRFIGDPESRIKEDHLRILRAIRFRNALGFEYSEETGLSIKQNACLLKKISSERIRDELVKIMCDKNRSSALQDMKKLGVLEMILPEINDMIGIEQPKEFHEEGDVFTHTCLVLKSLPKNASRELAFSALLHDVGKPRTFTITDRIRFNSHQEIGKEMTIQILKRLKFSNKDIKKISWLVAHHMILPDILKMRPARQNYWFSHEYFKDLLKLFRADIKGSLPRSMWLYREVFNLYQKYKKTFRKPLKKLVSGKDVMKICDILPGKRIGEILALVREKQLGLEIKTRSEALEFLKNLKN